MADSTDHDAFVDAWMERAAAARSVAQLIELLELALNALCTSAHKVLGEITLAAIVHRVLYNAAERYPFLADVMFQDSVVSCKKLLARTPPPDGASATDGVRFVIAETLTVMGNLTAETLTPAFHRELTKLVALAPAEAKDKSR